MQHDIRGRVEADRLASKQVQRGRAPDFRDQIRGGVRIDLLGRLPEEPEHDRGDAAVAVACGAERAEELDGHTRHGREHTCGVKPDNEPPRRAHRTDGVRA